MLFERAFPYSAKVLESFYVRDSLPASNGIFVLLDSLGILSLIILP